MEMRLTGSVVIALFTGLFGASALAAGTARVTYDGTNGVYNNIFNANSQQRCMDCHHSSLVDAARNGAPAEVNFNTYGWANTIPSFWAGDANGRNSYRGAQRADGGGMPPTGIDLTAGERALIAGWAPSSASPYQNDQPYVATPTASSVGRYDVTLNTNVSENGAESTFHFYYKTVAAGGYTTYTVNGSEEGDFGTDSDGNAATKGVSHSLSGLQCGTTYNYYADGTNSGGTTTSALGTNFVTSACPTITTDIANFSISEDANSGTLNINLNDGALTVSATSSNATLVPNNVSALNFTDTSGTTRAIVVTPSANQSGSTTITITASDGTTSDTDTFVLTVNAVNDTPIISSSAVTTATEDTAYSYDVNAADTNDTANANHASNLATEGSSITYSLSVFPSGMSINGSTGVISWTPTNAQSGASHSVTVLATDNGSPNLADSQSFSINVTAVNDAPTFSSSPSTTATEDALYSYDANASDIEGNTLTYSLFVAPAGMSINAASGVVTWTPTNAQALAGSHNVTVRVTDNGAPNLSTDQAFSITVSNVNDAPTVTSNAPTTCIEDNSCNFAPVAVDIDGDVTFTWGISNAPAGMSINPSTGAITWTPTNGQTTSGVVTITATDAGLLSGNTAFTIAVDGVNDPPLITSSAITIATEDVAYSYAVSVTDPDDSNNGIDLSWSLLSAPAGMSVSSTGVISWTPTEGILTSGTVTVRVADGGENGAAPATQSFTITVTAVDDAPIFSSAAVTSATEDVAYVYDANAADAEASTMTYSLLAAPAGMTINSSTGVINWTPTEGVSSSGTVTVRAAESDGVLTTNQSFTITVTAVNDAPLITSSASLTATEDTLYTYTATVSDPDDLNNGTQLTWSLLNPPTGMSVSATGVVTWTPLNGVTSSGAVTLRVADGGENSAAAATQIFTITVTPVNDSPILTPISNQAVTELSLFALTVTPSDADDANDGSGALTFSLSGQPPCIATGSICMMVSNLGGISFTPGQDMAGSYPITVTVTDGGENGSTPAVQSFTLTVNKLDSDGDTVADYHDNCPLPGIQNQNLDQLNTDGDTQGNVCDADDDNDQIPDVVEVAMGLDPLNAADALLDLDNDGLSNLAEYQICVANADPICATIAVDNVPPVITTNGSLIVNATGYVSAAGESATATDFHDGEVAVSADVISPFRPGRHTITWTAQDAAHNVATQDQQIDVLPLIQIDNNLLVGENNQVKVPVRMNGVAPTYPVEIQYTISGSASSADHSAVSGTLSIANGDGGLIEFTTSADSVTEADETVVITLISVSSNAVLSSDKVATISIVDRQAPPNVALEVEQNAIVTQQLFSDGGTVTLRANATDPNGGNLSYSWGETSNALAISVNNNIATFNPLSLVAGSYHVAVSVSDGLVTVKRETTVTIATSAPTLSNVSDTDSDGIDDQTEGLIDSDGDGVSDYLDPVNAFDLLNISNDDMNDRFDRLIETESGLHLSLGNQALAANHIGARISSVDIKDSNGNVINDSTFQLTGELFDFIVTGLNDVHKQAVIMIPLKTAILPGSVYRKFIGGAWRTFDANNGDTIATSLLVDGKCPALENTAAWSSGVHATHRCLRLKIADGGSNDADGIVNGAVADPGGLAVAKNKAEAAAPTRSQSGSGDIAWWTLLVMVALLSVRQLNRQTRSVRAWK